jgi:hypothetical protein
MGENVIPGVLVDCSFRGRSVQLHTRHEGDVVLELEMPGATDLPTVNAGVWLSLDPEAMVLLPQV